MREKKAVGAVWISMNNDGDEKIQFMIRCTLVKEKSEQKIQAKSAIVCLKMTVKHFTWWVFSLSPPFLSPFLPFYHSLYTAWLASNAQHSIQKYYERTERMNEQTTFTYCFRYHYALHFRDLHHRHSHTRARGMQKWLTA